MNILPAVAEDLPAIEEIYADARDYMRAHGNATQWTGGYPSRALILEDIRSGSCHVCREGGEILGVFSYFEGPDPTYARIEGQWLREGPYGVIHRVAVKAHRRGIASACFRWGWEKCGNLRMDTHENNLPMQHSLEKNGFIRCGVIRLANGDPRLAYQKIQ